MGRTKCLAIGQIPKKYLKGGLKYRNVPTVVDGKRFASKREAKRYSELRLMEKAGEIHNLVVHPRYPLEINGYKICTYVGDFAYMPINGQKKQWESIVEDVKGVKTDVYLIKKKLMRAIYAIDVVEV